MTVAPSRAGQALLQVYLLLSASAVTSRHQIAADAVITAQMVG
jgi:hypothetical protein